MRFFWSEASKARNATQEWTVGDIALSPTLAFKGDHLVDVFYSEWREHHRGNDLHVAVETSQPFTFSGAIDRIIFETPAGCFEAVMDLEYGGSFTLHPEGAGSYPAPNYSVPIRRCQRAAAIPVESEEAIR